MVRVLAAVLILLPLRLCGQDQSTIARPVNDFHYYFTLYSQADGQLAPSFDGLNDFLIRTDEKRKSFKSEKAFVYFLFSKTSKLFPSLPGVCFIQRPGFAWNLQLSDWLSADGSFA
jgi:hypothetical protein